MEKIIASLSACIVLEKACGQMTSGGWLRDIEKLRDI
jgi:hypothetical protein